MDEEPEFLSVTFDGGRFAAHTMPIAAMGEFATLERVLSIVARELFLQANPARQRIATGFAEAAALHFVSAEHNCFTARLAPVSSEGEFASLLDQACAVTLSALAAVQESQPLPSEFPSRGLSSLAALGKLLGDSESLSLGSRGRRAKVDQSSRKRLAKLIKQPFEVTGTVIGEVIEVNDAQSKCQVRNASFTVEIPFESSQRSLVLEALQNRPLHKVRAHGVLVQHHAQVLKMKQLDELELVEGPRAAEVRLLQQRIEKFLEMEDGWLEGEGHAPSRLVLEFASRVVSRLLIENDPIPRPQVYPTPEGGVQAEWSSPTWCVEALFVPGDERVEISATAAHGVEEFDQSFSWAEVTPDNVAVLAQCLAPLMGAP